MFDAAYGGLFSNADQRINSSNKFAKHNSFGWHNLGYNLVSPIKELAVNAILCTWIPNVNMASDRNTALTHVYGVLSLVPALVGLAFLVKGSAPWQEYALLASGWITAIFFWIMIFRYHNQGREDSEKIGALTEQVASLEQLVETRGATADLLGKH